MTTKIIRSDAFIASPVGTNSETFVLTGNNIRATVAGLNNNTSFIYGANNGLLLNSDGNESVYDRGVGTQITVAFPTGNVKIYGFGNDATANFTEMFTTTAGLQASIKPDGHGGTSVGVGSFTVDFVGAAHINPAQLHGTIPV